MNSENEHVTLNSAIFSLSLGTSTFSPTPFNSPVSSLAHTHTTDPPPNPSLDQSSANITDTVLNTATFTLRPFGAIPSDSSLYWTWVADKGRFMTIGVWQDNSRVGSETDSDETVVMLNLDMLNEGCLEWVSRDA